TLNVLEEEAEWTLLVEAHRRETQIVTLPGNLGGFRRFLKQHQPPPSPEFLSSSMSLLASSMVSSLVLLTLNRSCSRRFISRPRLRQIAKIALPWDLVALRGREALPAEPLAVVPLVCWLAELDGVDEWPLPLPLSSSARDVRTRPNSCRIRS